MKTIKKEYTVYKFSELSEEAKDKAISNEYDINVNYDWYQFTYEDAEQIGLRITEFDIERGNYAKGKFLESAKDTALYIINTHGKDTETYKDAANYLSEYDKLDKSTPPEDDIDTEDIDNDFLRTLLEDYRIILSKEYDYLTSKQAIIETIEANDYDFNEDGSIFNG